MPQKFWYVTLPEDEKPVIPERGKMMQGCEAGLEIENMAHSYIVLFVKITSRTNIASVGSAIKCTRKVYYVFSDSELRGKISLTYMTI